MIGVTLREGGIVRLSLNPRQALVALAICSALAGCGAGNGKSADDVPKPKHALSVWTAQFTKAAASGDCKALARLSFADCSSAKKNYRGARVVGSKQFRTGALVDFRDPHVPGRINTAILAATGDGWYEVFDNSFGRRTTPGKAPPSLTSYERAAKLWTAAVARRDCRSAYKYAASDLAPNRYCADVSKSPLPKILKASPNAKPVSLGGTRDVEFFGYFVRVPKGVGPGEAAKKAFDAYGTLAVVKVPPAQLKQATAPYLSTTLLPGPRP